MYENLSELLLDHGLQQITMDQLLMLPDSEDSAVQGYLRHLLDSAYDADSMCEDDSGMATQYVYAELERLWDEAVELLVEESIVMSPAIFWRVLSMLPVTFYNDECEEEDDLPKIDRDSILEVLDFGFVTTRDVPLAYSNFETILVSMPDEVIFDFLEGLHDEAKLQCLMRLTLADDRYIFCIDELYIRLLLSGSVVRNAMIQLFDGLGIMFDPDINAPIDDDWFSEDDIEDE